MEGLLKALESPDSLVIIDGNRRAIFQDMDPLGTLTWRM